MQLRFTDGRWHPSEVIALAFLGRDEEVGLITEERARQLVRNWRSHLRLRRLPKGLN